MMRLASEPDEDHADEAVKLIQTAATTCPAFQVELSQCHSRVLLKLIKTIKTNVQSLYFSATCS